MANVKDLLVNGSARVIGTIYGNATSANKVNHSLTFGSKSFNGSSAQTITLADLGGKPTQSAVSSPSVSGTEISFIDTISQNANGVISATKKTVRDASASQSGVVNTGAQTFAGAKTFNKAITLSTENYINVNNRSYIFTKNGDFNYSSLTPDNTSGNDEYMKAALKAICTKYPGFDSPIVLGELWPNAKGPMYGSIYSTSDFDSTTGLPKYSTFWFSNLNGNLKIFGTHNYNYYLKTVLDSDNYINYTVKKDGTGASGNWGISITGNASTASKVNNKLTFGSKTYDGSTAVTLAASDLGLASAMLFLGTTTTAITDGAKTNPVAIGGSNKTVTSGNVVLYGSKEFVWTGSAWEELGNEGSYKIVQAAVGDPSASGTSNTFIATISQDTNGKITATKKTVAVANSAPTLSWGTTSTIGTVAGTNLQVTMPANPNTWRGIQNNLTSDSTTDSLSAAQGKALKALIDGKAASSHTHNYAGSSSAGGAANSANKLATTRTITLSGAVTGSASFDGSKNITINTSTSQQTLPYSSSTSQLFVTSTANQASYTLSNFVDNAVYHVYVNGFKIPNSEYTVSSSGVVTLTNPPELTNQEVEIVANYTSYVTTDSSIYNSSYLNYYRQATAPSNTNALWLDTSATTSSSSFTPKLYDGGKWNAIGGVDTSTLDARYIKKTGDTMTGDLTAPTFIGNLNGNANSATKLKNFGLTADTIDNVNHTGLIYSTVGSYAGPGFGSNDAMILSMSWDNSNNYGAQIALDDTTTPNMYVRNKSGSWSAWSKVLLSTNYTDYTVKKDGTGASGTWGINISGNATGLKYHPTLGTDDDINNFNEANTFKAAIWNGTSSPGVSNGIILSGAWSSNSYGFQIAVDDDPGGYIALRQRDGNGWRAWKKFWLKGDSVTGAVWNDYAEYREADTIQGGRCVREVGDDTLALTTKRLMRGCSITSDTWGFAQGETDKAKTPIAVAGRVLAYPLEDRELFKEYIGYSVCSGPDGTVSLMTEEEELKYPWAIVGTVSAVPDYEEWGGGEMADRPSVKVDGRIWIKVK